MNNKDVITNNRYDQYDQIQLIRLEEVCRLSTLKKSTIFKCIKQGTIPKPMKLLGKINCWNKNEILAWLNSQRQ